MLSGVLFFRRNPVKGILARMSAPDPNRSGARDGAGASLRAAREGIRIGTPKSLAAAVRHAGAAIRENPRSGEGYILLGMALHRQGLLLRAVSALWRGLEVDPHPAEPENVFRILGEIVADIRTPAGRIAERLARLSLSPGDPDYHFLRAWLFLCRGREAEADRLAREGLARDPGRLEDYREIQRCRNEGYAKRYREGIPFWKKYTTASERLVEEAGVLLASFLMLACAVWETGFKWKSLDGLYGKISICFSGLTLPLLLAAIPLELMPPERHPLLRRFCKVVMFAVGALALCALALLDDPWHKSLVLSVPPTLFVLFLAYLAMKAFRIGSPQSSARPRDPPPPPPPEGG